MATPSIRNKRSSVSGKVPTTTDLAFGEFGINTNDGKVFISASNAVVGIGTTVITVNPWSVGVGTTAYNTYFNAGNVGVGTTRPTSTLHIVGNELITGISTIGSISINSGVITATTGVVTYYGDGSKLTGIVASGTGVAVQNSGSALGTATTINFSTNLTATFGGGIVTVTAASGSGVNYWTQNSTGIHTLSNIGIGTTNAVSAISIGSTGVINFANNNVRIGDSTTGCSITSGTSNNFFGYSAGRYNTTGNYNNFFGRNAGCANTSASNNNFLGNAAGCSNTSGGANNFFGAVAGKYNTTGNNNNFFGFRAGFCNTTGSNNNFFGRCAGFCNTTGNYNNFFGRCAGFCNTTGNYNNFFGSYIGISTSASNKIIIGSGSSTTGLFDSPDTTKNIQLAIGVRTDSNPANYWIVGNENFNVGIGTTNPQTKLQVGGVIGFNDTNVRVGDSTTGSGISTGTNNNFIGVGAGQSTTIGFNNNFFGYQAGIANTSGDNNSFFGYQSGFSNTSGSCNIFFGFQSGYCNTTASQNQFFGFQAGYYNTTGGGNLFIGRRAGYRNTSATFNTFIGRYAGCSNTIGINNNFMGQSAGLLNTTGNRNNFFGALAGCGNTSGSYNNFFGCGSGTLNTSGNENIFLGRFSGCTNATGSCNIVIGSGRTSTPVLNGDNQLVIGVGSTDWIIGNSSFNVGIGTTNPTSKLQVQGDTLVSGVVTATTFIGNLTGTATTATNVIGGIGSISSLTVSGIATISNNLIVNGNTLYVDATNNRVGILTTIPLQPFQVSTGSSVVVIDTSGELGIGTTNPTSKLDIRGVLSIGATNTSHIGIISSVQGIEAWKYTGVVKSIATEDSAPQDIFFKSDGTKMFIVGNTNDRVYEYALGTAWNVSTAGFTTFFSVASQDTTPLGLSFKSDGTVMYVTGQTGVSPLVAGGDYVHQYTLGTAWDISNVGGATVGWTTSYRILEETAPSAIRFKSDGTKMFIPGYTNDQIYEYALGTPWNVSTAGFTTSVLIGVGITFNVASDLNFPQGIEFNSTGSELYLLDSTRDAIYKFNLSTPWDLNTISLDDYVFTGHQDSAPVGIYYSENQLKLFLIGNAGDSVYEYSTNDSALKLSSAGISTSSSFIINNETRIKDRLYVDNDCRLNDDVYVRGTLNNEGNLNHFGNTSSLSTNTGATVTVNLGAAALVSGLQKTINIGTLGLAGSRLLVNVGSATAGTISTVVVNPETNVLIGSSSTTGTSSQPLQVTGGAYVSGNLGIGTTNPTSKLQVQGDALVSGIVTAAQLDLTANASVNDSVLYLSGSPSGTASQNGILGIGTLSFTDTNVIANFSHNVNSYAQLVVQNRNSGSTASADIIVNNDRTAGTTYYGDFGINATTYTGTSPFNDPDGTYLYAAGGTLAIGTNDAQDFRIATGSAAATPVTRMTITGTTGRIGIGTTTPIQQFQVGSGTRVVVIDSNGDVGIGTTNPQAKLHIIGGTTAAGTAPLEISRGSLLTSIESDVFEYDGVNLYHTAADLTNGHGRTVIQETQFYRLSTERPAITATNVGLATAAGVSWFGVTNRPSLISGYTYEFEYNLSYSRATTNAGLSFVFTASSGSITDIGAFVLPASGGQVGAALTTGSGPSVACTATANINAATSGIMQIRGFVIPGANMKLNLSVFQTAGGTTTPRRNSWYKFSAIGIGTAIGNIS